MAAVAQSALTIEQYLSTSFEVDMEYIDGELREKPVTAFIHGRVQILLGVWFRQFEKELEIVAGVEARTLVAPERVRLPDFLLVRAARLERKVVTSPPLLVIEVLSDDDKHKDLVARAKDLESLGCPAIWLLDPEEQTLQAWSGEAWVPVLEQKPMTPAGAPLDLPWLWAELGPLLSTLDEDVR